MFGSIMLSKTTKAIVLLTFGLLSTNAFAEGYSCGDEMTKAPGSAHSVTGNKTGDVDGTSWGYEQWSSGGSNVMTYYDNGTFKASWNNADEYMARVGFRYGDEGPGVDHKTKQYAANYYYSKSGNAQKGYIGVYGWTVNPQVEFFIVDDWYNKPNENDIGEKFGELEVDGAKYTIHAFLRQNERSQTSSSSTFLQIFSVRQSPRQCGHIDISAHFKKWDELFTGQNKHLNGSKGGGSATLKFGKLTEVSLMTGARGMATGSVEYTYFDMVDNASSSSETPETSSSSVKSSSSVAIKIDACTDAMGHEGTEKITYGQNNNSVTGNVGSSPFHYEIWYQGGNNSLTYYDNGTYKASWSGTNDFLARVGFKYDEKHTYEELGPIDAYFKWTKSGSGGEYNYIGIYGWTVDPLVEYYIVDDWFKRPGIDLTGTKKGEFEVDGAVYEVYQNQRYNAPSIKGQASFPQYFSVRKSYRNCGHIDVTAHFKKWESFGMKMGKMYEAKVLIEAGGGSGSFDVTYLKMTDAAHPLSAPEVSSSSEVKSSSSSKRPKSSSSKNKSSSSEENNTTVIEPLQKILTDNSGRSLLVFDMQGRYLGTVEYKQGLDLKQILFEKFRKQGMYLVRRGKTSRMVRITP